MQVKIKKLSPNAKIPSYAKPGDAGMDLTAIRLDADIYDNLVYYTGLSIEIPDGYVGLIFPRSSVSSKGLILTNSVGVIDSGYRGEIIFKFKKIDKYNERYYPGDRIGQLVIMPYPKIEFLEVDELSDSVRGDGGYGSTGN